MMNETQNRRLAITLGCVLVFVMFFMMPLTRPTMLATFAVFAHVVLWIFDCAFGAEAFGIPPFVTWALVGAVIGAALGYWHIAPAVGRRRMRRVAGAIPVTLVICLFVGDVLVSLTTAPKPPSLQPVAMQRAPTKTVAKPIEDPNNEPAPGMYSTPKEDVLSTAAEGGGGDPKDSSIGMSPPVVPMSDHPNTITDLAGRSIGTDHATVDPSRSPQDH